MIEDIIYNLANNIDVLETTRMIAEYKEANKNFIGKNRQKTNRELLELEDILSEEKKQNQARRQLDLRLDQVRDLTWKMKKFSLFNGLSLITLWPT